MKNQSMLLLAVIAGTLSVGPALAGDSHDDQVVVTDYSGKPPFKRQVVARDEVLTADESDAPAADADSADRVQVVELRGAPPFKRQLVPAEALERAEFAQLETSGDASDARRGPPGKPNSRR